MTQRKTVRLLSFHKNVAQAHILAGLEIRDVGFCENAKFTRDLFSDLPH